MTWLIWMFGAYSIVIIAQAVSMDIELSSKKLRALILIAAFAVSLSLFPFALGHGLYGFKELWANELWVGAFCILSAITALFRSFVQNSIGFEVPLLKKVDERILRLSAFPWLSFIGVALFTQCLGLHYLQLEFWKNAVVGATLLLLVVLTVFVGITSVQKLMKTKLLNSLFSMQLLFLILTFLTLGEEPMESDLKFSVGLWEALAIVIPVGLGLLMALIKKKSKGFEALYENESWE